MLIDATKELGAPINSQKLEDDLNAWQQRDLSQEEIDDLGTTVLNTAKRFGKARFAQVASRSADECDELPAYIQQALDWLNE